MKKFFLFLLTAVMTLSLVSCNQSTGSQNSFIALGNDEVLTVGDNNTRFMNYEDETVEVKELTYTLKVKHTLRRTSYYDSDYVLYKGYYYYWETDVQTETQELGKKTTQRIYQYEYLPYIENENILVKCTVTTKTSFDYEGGWIEKTADVKTSLNGYFASFEALKKECPELADKIDTTSTNNYYIDVTVPDKITTSTDFYDTYYYIEKK